MTHKVIASVAALVASGIVLLATSPARADRAIIKNPGMHPDYLFEAEPHGLIGLWDPPGRADAPGLGVGFRGTFEIVDNGFIPSINNTVGIGFGLDLVNYFDDDECVRIGGDVVCDDRFDDDDLYVWLPVVMQWNFWLSENWSVFGEPGFAFRFYDDDFEDDRFDDDDDLDFAFDPFIFHGGGRWHFADAASLTMRIGWPTTFSIGVSFFI